MRGKLRYGDIKQIAIMAGSSYDAAYSVLSGRRGKRGGIKIKNVASKLLASREALVEEINQQ